MSTRAKMNGDLLRILLAVCFCAACAPGQETPKSAPAEAATTGQPPKDTWLHVVDVDVYPVRGAVVRDGEILIKNGRIEAVGHDLVAPAEAQRLEGLGMRAYPGLVALNGDNVVPSTGGRPEHASDPNGLWTTLGLAHGITTVITGNDAVKLVSGTVDDYVLRQNLFSGLFYSSSNPQAKQKLREELRRAHEYLRRKNDPPTALELERHRAEAEKAEKAAAGGEKAKKPETDEQRAQKELGAAARHLPLLEGKQIAVFNVTEAHDILEACELVSAFGFKAVLRGVAEGWTVADAMGRAGVSAILSPRERHDPEESINRPTGSTIANAAILHRHGVPVAIATMENRVDLDGQPGRDALAVAFGAGAAVRGGLPEQAALEAVTITAAACYGLDDRIGSIEPGKDADLVIVDGELLHYATMVHWAIVNGRIVYDKEKQPLLRHIRPRDPAHAKTDQWWPRPFAPMPDAWRRDPVTTEQPAEPTPAAETPEAPATPPEAPAATPETPVTPEAPPAPAPDPVEDGAAA